MKVGLAAAILGYLIYAVDIGQILEAAEKARTGWILGALALLPLNVFLEGVGWHLLVRIEVPTVHWKMSFESLLAGHALGLSTPARLGEYAGRAFSLQHKNRGTLLALVLTDHLITKVVGVSIGLGAFFYFLHVFSPTPLHLWRAVALYGAAMALMLIVFVLFPRFAYRVLHHVVRLARLRRHLQFLQTVSTRLMLLLLTAAALRYAVYSMQFVLLIYAFAPAVAFHTAYIGVVLVFFVKFLLPSVTLFDLGIREGAAVFFLGLWGYTGAVAFNAAFLLFCINLLLPAMVGIPFVFRLKPSVSTSSSGA
ncbi:MAG: lysylphosphatidylglycerol synthase transmembrane domain-containing protein [Rhodothermales bacterium]